MKEGISHIVTKTDTSEMTQFIPDQIVEFAKGLGKTDLDDRVAKARKKCEEATHNVQMKFIEARGENSLVRIGSDEIEIPTAHLQSVTAQS